MIRIISVVSNDIATDNRIHKIAVSLGENGYNVTIVGRQLRDSLRLSERPYHTRRLKLLFNQGPLFYVNLNFRFLLYLLRFRGQIILSNDLDTLPACYIASKIKREKLIFDSHELFSEIPELVHRPATKKVWLSLENYFLKRIQSGFTVCQSIANHYKEKYGVSFEVIRNLARFRYNYEFEKIQKKSREKIIIYQGALNLGRGLELLIESMQFIPNAKLWIIGKGDIEHKLRKLVRKLKLVDRVDFMGRVSLEDLWNYTPIADIGVSLEENLGLNYRYALPNKLFDYLQARIPVVISDLDEMKRIVENFDIGKVIYERTPEKLAEVISGLIKNELKDDYYKPKLELAARELCWEQEEEKLLNLFRHERNSE